MLIALSCQWAMPRLVVDSKVEITRNAKMTLDSLRRWGRLARKSLHRQYHSGALCASKAGVGGIMSPRLPDQLPPIKNGNARRRRRFSVDSFTVGRKNYDQIRSESILARIPLRLGCQRIGTVVSRRKMLDCRHSPRQAPLRSAGLLRLGEPWSKDQASRR